MRRLLELIRRWIMGHRILYIAKPKEQGIKLGLLYNWFAATDARKISSSDDWILPTQSQVEQLALPYGGAFSNTAGSAFKETGTVYWSEPNSDATNTTKFNARGAGQRRGSDGVFSFIQTNGFFWTQTEYSQNNEVINFYFVYSIGSFSMYYRNTKEMAFSIRLMNPNTSLSHGETGTYSGNDGKVYLTICINGVEWLAENLAETKYRNGDIIPEVTDNTAWAALTTGALCAYDNDWNNV